MTSPLLEHPTPDFAELVQVLRGEREPKRVHLVELLIDDEILQAITERYLGKPRIPLTAESQEPYFKQLVTLYYRLSYELCAHFPLAIRLDESPLSREATKRGYG